MELVRISKDDYFEVWCTVCKILVSAWSSKYGLTPLYEITACPKCGSNYIDTVDPVVLGILGRTDVLKKIEEQKVAEVETVTAKDIEGNNEN